MIAAMIAGRLKDPATRTATEKGIVTSAQLIATDATNRAQVVEISTTEETIGRTLAKLAAGVSVSVTGVATVLANGRLHVRARTLQTIDGSAEN